MDDSLPFLTQSPGFVGTIKQSQTDFYVEETPLYTASGEGEHLYLQIEKRGVSTPELVKHLSRRLSISAGEIGIAGRKDRNAVTRQYISLPARACPDPATLETEHITVLSAVRHGNKLRTGHLSGNRFRIVVRNTTDNAISLAQNTADEISRFGIPNYFGEQRFGNQNDTDLEGFQLLRGELKRRLSADDLRFALSAAQSRLFNTWAARRIRSNLAHQVQLGDVMQVTASGGCFLVEDCEVEQLRLNSRETAITGPMFGPKMLAPTGEPGRAEDQVLTDSGLTRAAFEKFAKLTSGTRRQLLLFPSELSISEVSDGLEFAFTLPPGAYATTVMREFFKGSSSCELSSER